MPIISDEKFTPDTSTRIFQTSKDGYLLQLFPEVGEDKNFVRFWSPDTAHQITKYRRINAKPILIKQSADANIGFEVGMEESAKHELCKNDKTFEVIVADDQYTYSVLANTIEQKLGKAGLTVIIGSLLS